MKDDQYFNEFSESEIIERFNSDEWHLRMSIFSCSNIPKHILLRAVKDKDEVIRYKATNYEYLDEDVLIEALDGIETDAQLAAVRHHMATDKVLTVALKKTNISNEVKCSAILNKNASKDTLIFAVKDPNADIRNSALSNPNVDKDILRQAIFSQDPVTLLSVVRSPKADEEIIALVLEVIKITRNHSWIDPILSHIISSGNSSANLLKIIIALNPSINSMINIANHHSVDEEILSSLMFNPYSVVRECAAKNPKSKSLPDETWLRFISNGNLDNYSTKISVPIRVLLHPNFNSCYLIGCLSKQGK